MPRVIRRILPIGLMSTLLLISGCASVSPTQVGQTAGSIAGAALAPGVGMPIGALIGSLAGMLVEQEMDKSRQKKERVELTKELNRPATPTDAGPELQIQGQPTRVWVDEHVERGRLITGHFEQRVIQ